MNRSPHDRRRRALRAIAMATFTITLFVSMVAGWARHSLFDSREFAVRAVATLDSSAVRHELAEQITDQILVQSDSTLASYRSVLVGVVSDIIETDAFRTAFRTAVEETHRTVMLEHANKALLQLGASLADLTGSAEDASPGMAQSLPEDIDSVLVDVTPLVDRIDPYRLGRHVDEVAYVATALTVLSGAVAFALARRRRRALMWLGMAAVVASIGVLGVSAFVPNYAADRVADPALAAPVRAGITRFMADLDSLAIGMIAVGVLVAAAATAAASPNLGADLRRLGRRVTEASVGDLGTGYQVAAGVGLVVAGSIAFFDADVAVALVLATLGAALGYLGLVSLFDAVLGPALPAAESATADAAHRDLAGVEWTPRLVVMCVLAVLLSIVAGGLSVGAIVRTGDKFAAAAEVRCNGSAALCDKRLDQVVFAGSHNSMSSSSDPGWLFAEQTTDIPAQLRAGVRALLVKSHYGIPTGVTVGGAELVVTDESDETAVNRQEEIAELGPEAVARAEQLRATTKPTASGRDIYLCHVYCELGATRFSVALHDIRRFIDSHPDDVVMLFIGDYVSAADTATAFEDAGLTDRSWTYDTSQPPPTLREMVKARRTLLVLSEHSQPPPPWYTAGYGIFQDTPFTFAAPSDFNCDRSRGPADAPLFEINHFITNAKPPSAEEARQVNSEAALTARVDQCRQVRGRPPTILAVDFASVGDLLAVVDDLNSR